ncbi:MAG TPA: methyltransferase [Rhodospirillaceae bacterium]|nr:methyltransferase [Rhodospirillaceae bacterium]
MSAPEEIFVLDKRVRLLQPPEGFRTSLDSVMLAAACPAQRGDRILDMGCGVGGAGLCVLTRIPDAQLTGIDIQDDHIDLAIRNASLNGMEDRTEFLASDVCDYNGGKKFDHIICNPPYQETGERTQSPSSKKETAHAHREDITLHDWIDCAVRNLKAKGSLTVIHRADQADKILQSLEGRFGGTEIIPLWPRENTPAKRVIIRACRDSRSPATIHPGLVLHKENGDYTDEADDILRRALPIS